MKRRSIIASRSPVNTWSIESRMPADKLSYGDAGGGSGSSSTGAMTPDAGGGVVSFVFSPEQAVAAATMSSATAIRREVKRSFPLLAPDHDDREGTWNRTAAATAATRRWRRPCGRRRRRRRGFRGHQEEMARLAVERLCARAVERPRLQILDGLKTGRALL